ncbi:MAG: tyrosine-type recombinase/integrase [Candidatus Bathyarchaeia archaeon]
MGSNPIPCTTTYTPRTEFLEYLKQHVREVTAHGYLRKIKRLSKLGNIDDPARMKVLICTHPSSEANKDLLTNAYDYYVKFIGQAWEKPTFKREDTPIFLPLESEIDALISRAHPKLSVYLQFIKETGADSGEAWKQRWIDLDTTRKTTNITPTKNHNARTLPISETLLTKLIRLPRKNDRIFASKDFESFRRNYCKMKTRLAEETGNPRFRQISFRSIRHFKGTMEYYKTRDILHVKYVLGHKRIENTLVYTHLLPIRDEEFVCKVARTLQEATALVESGFEYVTEMDGVKIFRKRK